MSSFKIEIQGDFDGNVSWNIWFSDEAENKSDADNDYIINIAQDLATSLEKIKNIKKRSNDDIAYKYTCWGKQPTETLQGFVRRVPQAVHYP